MDNPCPPCQNWKDYLDRTLAEIAALEQENRTLADELAGLDRGIADRQKQIEDLRTRIRLQEGTGGSASNYPQPGWKTESVTQADGRVKITVTDASGRVVEERYRERSDLGRMRKEIDDLDASIARDKARQEEIRKRMETVQRGLASKKSQADAYRSGLADCIREKCGVQVSDSAALITPSTPAGKAPEPAQTGNVPPPAKTETVQQPAVPPAPPRQTGCAVTPSKPLQVGPRSEVGSGIEHSAKAAVGGFFGGLVGQATGGMIGMGGSVGGGGDADQGPDVVSNPVPDENKQVFDVGNDIKIEIGTMWTPEGLLISQEILDAPDKGTFQATAMQRPDCSWELPDKYLWYKLWLEWSLTVNWTHDHYVDNQLVKHEEGSSHTFGSQDIASGVFKVSGEAAKPESALLGSMPIWQRAGFSGATGGIQSMGTLYRVTPQQLENSASHLVVHVTDPRLDPVVTVPLDFVVVGSGLMARSKAPGSIPGLGGIPVIQGMLKKDSARSSDTPLILLIRPSLTRLPDAE